MDVPIVTTLDSIDIFIIITKARTNIFKDILVQLFLTIQINKLF